MFLIYYLCKCFTEFISDHGDYTVLNTGHQDLTMDLSGPLLGLTLMWVRVAVAVLTKWHLLEWKSSYIFLEEARGLGVRIRAHILWGKPSPCLACASMSLCLGTTSFIPLGPTQAQGCSLQSQEARVVEARQGRGESLPPSQHLSKPSFPQIFWMVIWGNWPLLFAIKWFLTYGNLFIISINPKGMGLFSQRFPLASKIVDISR